MAKSRNVKANDRLTIGIDTGGTYTDALVYARSTNAVVAKTKVRTTHGNLRGCVSTALSDVLAHPLVDTSNIDLVCVSTTLATNALVEGAGRPAGLITIGLEAAVTKRGGLSELTQENPLLHLRGGHSSYGLENEPLDLGPLREWLSANDGTLEAYAVVGSFSVRNPEHELVTATAIHEITDKPVTLSHELSAQLDAPKRSVTALLNARLVPLVQELIVAVENAMTNLGVTGRLLVMRGDGSLVSSDFVKNRPIETILSGPAASATGAAALSGIRDGVVADIGGTTTDVAIINDGRSAVRPGGANVGGYETMVNAIRIHTHGIGGDSHVRPTPLLEMSLSIGPRRVTPLALASRERPEIVEMLEGQLARPVASANDGIFLWTQASGRDWTPQSSVEAKVLEAVNGSLAVASMGDIVSSGLEGNAVERLISIGVLASAAFTPTDAAHVLGIDNRYDPLPSHLAADVLARQRDRFGAPLADSGAQLSDDVMNSVAQMIGNTILAAGADDDGVPAAELASAIRAQDYLSRSASKHRVLDVSLGIRNPFVCVGAPAPLYQSKLHDYLTSLCQIPEHFDVANAYGAATGVVRLSTSTIVSAPRRGLFRVHAGNPATFYELNAAQDFAEAEARTELEAKMEFAGAAEFAISHKWQVKEVNVGGRQLFIEGTLYSEAEGSPH